MESEQLTYFYHGKKIYNFQVWKLYSHSRKWKFCPGMTSSPQKFSWEIGLSTMSCMDLSSMISSGEKSFSCMVISFSCMEISCLCMKMKFSCMQLLCHDVFMHETFHISKVPFEGMYLPVFQLYITVAESMQWLLR